MLGSWRATSNIDGDFKLNVHLVDAPPQLDGWSCGWRVLANIDAIIADFKATGNLALDGEMRAGGLDADGAHALTVLTMTCTLHVLHVAAARRVGKIPLHARFAGGNGPHNCLAACSALSILQ